jgi:hypothetical protein
MKLIVTGRKALGGVRMRGVAVAEKLGVPFIDLKDLETSGKHDTILLVKYWHSKHADYSAIIRRHCDRLVYDPLDVFSSTKPKADAIIFWNWVFGKVRPDEMIATSPACAETMRATADETPIHMLPHHADPRIGPDWHNPNGPIVYAGGVRFIKSALRDIDHACTRLGKRLSLDYSRDCWQRLQGASLCLHLRLPPEDTELNRYCKPQVKLENAAAAGLPCLVTPDPCVTSLGKKTITLFDVEPTPKEWMDAIEYAARRKPVSNPVTLDDHVNTLSEVLGV